MRYSIQQAVPRHALGNVIALSTFFVSVIILGTAAGKPLSLRGSPTRRSVEEGLSSNSSFYEYRKDPVSPLPSEVSEDAPWTQAEESYQEAISCPFGIQNLKGGIVFLVPGTATSARESYGSSPYYQLLPSHGFDVCWIETPNYSLSDMQLTAEFVAYGIKYLAAKSTATGGKINIISWSQGGANADEIQPAFWPSIREHVIGHVALAPSMKGTLAAALMCPITGACFPSLLQQSAYSHYVKAANNLKDKASAAYALIPTTIVFTYTDEVVTPQVGSRASSRLIGASNIGLQDICGPTYNIDHVSIVGDVVAYGIALNALLGGRPATPSTVDRSYCTKTAESLGYTLGNSINNLRVALRVLIGAPRVDMIAKEFLTLRLPQEPPLQQYVCDRGYSTSRCTRDAFKDTQ